MRAPGIASATRTDIGELTALFTAHSGGKLPTGVSADLALEIVLNEIVEQACLATRASGAAVLLERDGEMMCRASSGVNAPHLGARVGTAGLTAECIRTRLVQRCDDAQSDPRADVEASRTLGVRSVMVLPLLRDGVLAGVLEVFSSQPGAFRERDELTLQALAQQILKNLARAHQPILAKQPEPPPPPPLSLSESEVEEFATSLHSVSEPAPVRHDGESLPKPADRRMTLALSAAVLVCSVLLAIVVGYRLGWQKIAAEKIAAEKKSTPSEQSGASTIRPEALAVPVSGAGNPPSSNSTANAAPSKGETPGSGRKDTSPGKSSTRSSESSPPEGGLAVYENGKEIFRMPPTGQASPAISAQKGSPPIKNDQPPSALVPAGIIELTPEAAEGSLLHRVEPEYPEAARQQKIQGAVVLDVRIGRDGGIQDVKVISGPSLLADAATTAVKQWRFRPQTRSGKPVEMQTRVTLNFRLPI